MKKSFLFLIPLSIFVMSVSLGCSGGGDDEKGGPPATNANVKPDTSKPSSDVNPGNAAPEAPK